MMQPPQARNSRPHKRSAARQEVLLDALRQGASREAAAAAAGIDRTTAWRWAQDDPALAAEVEQACGQAEVMMTQRVFDAAPSDWRAAAWWLERRRPAVYGRHARPEVDLRVLAQRVADGEGLDVDDVWAEAQAIMARYMDPYDDRSR